MTKEARAAWDKAKKETTICSICGAECECAEFCMNPCCENCWGDYWMPTTEVDAVVDHNEDDDCESCDDDDF